MTDILQNIRSGKISLGIEFGSTRIKAVLVDESCHPIASGSHTWENQLEEGVWTYALKDVWSGVQDCYAQLKADVLEKYGERLTKIGCIGISAMMHGYLPFDKDGKQLSRFRTWRNTMTAEASEELTQLLGFNVPQRWTVAHLYQAASAGEKHVADIAHLTTLAGYVHWQLTGRKVVGVGEGSGIFPIDAATGTYDESRVAKFDEKMRPFGYHWRIRDVLPAVLPAGADAGSLTVAGAKLLDPSGELEAGAPFCPPEGDAGTGMVATNSIAPYTGNVSAGTSVFAMIVLDKPLSRVYPEIDMVATPVGAPVAMVHCNNCTTDLNAWIGLFSEFAKMVGLKLTPDELYGTLYRKAMEGDPDAGGLLSYNFYSGEHIAKLEEGRPLFTRTPDSHFTLANFMRANLYAAFSVLKSGMEILKNEHVRIDKIFGHGGVFKTKGVMQSILASGIHAPVYVMETAGEGGAWGMALLAEYRRANASRTLADYLDNTVFAESVGEPMLPVKEDEAGFDAYLERFMGGMSVEREAINCLKD